MSAARFQTVRSDGRAYWRVAFEYIVAEAEAGRLHIGDMISHEQLTTVMEMETGPAYYQAVRKAVVRLQRDHGRSLRAVPRAGYQFVAGAGQVEVARNHQGKGQRALARAVETAVTVDEQMLGGVAEVDLHRRVVVGLRAMAQVAEMHAERLADHEAEIERLKVARIDDRARVEDEIRALAERVEAVEAGRAGTSA